MATPALSPQEYHARRDRDRREQRESARLAVLDQVRSSVVRLAPRFPGIRAVYLFGSLMQPGRFSPRSDVDVAVDGDLESETPFWRALEEALERNVDLRPLTGPITRAVEAHGERCYAREADPAREQRSG